MEKVKQETESFIGIPMVVSHAHRSFQVPLDGASCRNCSTSEYRFVVVNEPNFVTIGLKTRSVATADERN
jgi:hypothetical protein